MSRERLLILFGPEGLEDLTTKARNTVGAVSDAFYQHQNMVDGVVSIGEKWGILPSDKEPFPLVRRAKEALSLEEEKLVTLNSIEAFLKDQRNRRNGKI
ncbi:MAG: hypothetical protein AAB599_01570 [Patescibacteria group bacterium]